MDTASKIKVFSLILIGLLGAANIILLDFMVVDLRSKPVPAPKVVETTNFVSPPAQPVAEVVPDLSCPQSCVSLISAIPKQQTVSTPVVQQITTPKGEYFINLGTGSVLNTEASSSNWKTIDSAQATFDAANYGNIKSATLEVFLHVQSSGDVHARLFDSTTPAVFWTSDLLTNSATSVYKSAPITLSSGSKTYKIQMYSTLSTGFLDQARIHIITQ